MTYPEDLSLSFNASIRIGKTCDTESLISSFSKGLSSQLTPIFEIEDLYSSQKSLEDSSSHGRNSIFGDIDSVKSSKVSQGNSLTTESISLDDSSVALRSDQFDHGSLDHCNTDSTQQISLFTNNPQKSTCRPLCDEGDLNTTKSIDSDHSSTNKSRSFSPMVNREANFYDENQATPSQNQEVTLSQWEEVVHGSQSSPSREQSSLYRTDFEVTTIDPGDYEYSNSKDSTSDPTLTTQQPQHVNASQIYPTSTINRLRQIIKQRYTKCNMRSRNGEITRRKNLSFFSLFEKEGGSSKEVLNASTAKETRQKGVITNEKHQASNLALQVRSRHNSQEPSGNFSVLHGEARGKKRRVLGEKIALFSKEKQKASRCDFRTKCTEKGPCSKRKRNLRNVHELFFSKRSTKKSSFGTKQLTTIPLKSSESKMKESPIDPFTIKNTVRGSYESSPKELMRRSTSKRKPEIDLRDRMAINSRSDSPRSQKIERERSILREYLNGSRGLARFENKSVKRRTPIRHRMLSQKSRSTNQYGRGDENMHLHSSRDSLELSPELFDTESRFRENEFEETAILQLLRGLVHQRLKQIEKFEGLDKN